MATLKFSYDGGTMTYVVVLRHRAQFARSCMPIVLTPNRLKIILTAYIVNELLYRSRGPITDRQLWLFQQLLWYKCNYCGSSVAVFAYLIIWRKNSNIKNFNHTFIWFQETTARLLFMAVRWVRCLAPFQTLSKRDQVR